MKDCLHTGAKLSVLPTPLSSPLSCKFTRKLGSIFGVVNTLTFVGCGGVGVP